MVHLLIVLLVLQGTLLHTSVADPIPQDEANIERRLVGGLLGGVLGGGGKEGKEGGGGGLLGGLLGGGGGGGLLGGLLGGGGGGGLLGGLLGGKDGGLLGGLLGGKDGGLLGGLLGGGGGGLLGGLLGGKEGGLLGGLLGGDGLGKILNALFCLIEQLGLGVVLNLLNGVGIEKAVGLNEIACQEGGPSLLNLLLSKDGLLSLPLLDEVLCLVKSVGLKAVLSLVNDLGLDALVNLRNITCPDGVPLIEQGSTAAGLLETLTELLGVDIVVEAGLDGILKLDKLLAQEGITDLKAFIVRVLCLIKTIGLGTVIDVVELVGASGSLRLNDVTCAKNSSLAEIEIVLKAGVNIRAVFPPLLKALGLDYVATQISDIGIGKIVHLAHHLVMNGTIEVQVLREILCISGSTGLTVVVDLLINIGLSETLRLHAIICPSGQAVPFPAGTNPSFLVDLLGTCIKEDVPLCLGTLNSALTAQGDVVCRFCTLIYIKAVEEECTNVCERRLGGS